MINASENDMEDIRHGHDYTFGFMNDHTEISRPTWYDL